MADHIYQYRKTNKDSKTFLAQMHFQQQSLYQNVFFTHKQNQYPAKLEGFSSSILQPSEK